jgi:predicted transcriptional regulator
VEPEAAERAVQFASLEAGAELLSAKTGCCCARIAEQRPASVTELAAMTGRAE